LAERTLPHRPALDGVRALAVLAVLLYHGDVPWTQGGFLGVDLFFVLTNGGPYGATEIPTTYLVKTVFKSHEVGYGSAMAVLLTAIVLGVGFAYTRIQARRQRSEAAA